MAPRSGQPGQSTPLKNMAHCGIAFFIQAMLAVIFFHSLLTKSEPIHALDMPWEIWARWACALLTSDVYRNRNTRTDDTVHIVMRLEWHYDLQKPKFHIAEAAWRACANAVGNGLVQELLFIAIPLSEVQADGGIDMVKDLTALIYLLELDDCDDDDAVFRLPSQLPVQDAVGASPIGAPRA